MTYVLFTIGDKKTRVATSADLKHLDQEMSFKTPTKFADGIEKINQAVKKLTEKKPLAIAGGIRGLLNEEKTSVENDSVLKDWIGKSLVKALQKKHNVPVHLENDFTLAGIGEAVFGAGHGLDIVVYHTVGEGVEGIKIENGQPDQASIAFDPGQQVLDIDRTILGEEIAPTLENLVSSTAIKDRYGVDPNEIPENDVMWDELAGYLAQGLRNTILYWSPDVIVLGGDIITNKPGINIDTIRKYTVEAVEDSAITPLITLAKLGDEASLYGAMAILKSHQ